MDDEKLIDIAVNGITAAEEWSSFWSAEDARKLVCAALSALEASGYAVSQGWRPIETAPRDGTLVVALCFEDYSQVVSWDSEIDYGEEGVSQIWKSILTDKFVIPTHWMPLPEPPEKETGDD